MATNSAVQVVAATANKCRTEGMIADMINLATVSRAMTSRVSTNHATINRVLAGTTTVPIIRITPASNGTMDKMTVLMGMAGTERTKYVTPKVAKERGPRIAMDAKIGGAMAQPTTTVVALGAITEVVSPVREETMEEMHMRLILTTTT